MEMENLFAAARSIMVGAGNTSKVEIDNKYFSPAPSPPDPPRCHMVINFPRDEWRLINNAVMIAGMGPCMIVNDGRRYVVYVPRQLITKMQLSIGRYFIRIISDVGPDIIQYYENTLGDFNESNHENYPG